MSLDDIVCVVEKVKERIQKYGSTLRQSETRTRYALVDPILRNLGWDLDDLEQVIPEYTTGNNKRADYALLTEGGKPALFIEVKKLDRPLSEGLNQSIVYCIEEGVKYFAVPDGARWEVYDTHEPVPIAQKKFLEFSLSEPAHEFVMKALFLWRGNLIGLNPIATPMKEPERIQGRRAVFEDTPGEPSVPEDRWTPLSKLSPSPQLEVVNDKWVSFSQLSVKKFDPPPRAIRFPDNVETTTKKWVHVLDVVTRWLINNGVLTPAQCPIRLTANRYLVNVQPKHPDGKSYTGSKQVDGLFLETNYNGPDTFRNTKIMLEKLGQSIADFYAHI